MSCLCIEDYLFSLFFWVDLASALGMVLDVSLVDSLLFATTSSVGTGITIMSKSAKSTKASQSTIRMIKIIKLLRILRIAKLYRSAVGAKEFHSRRKELRSRHIKKKTKAPLTNSVLPLNIEENTHGTESMCRHSPDSHHTVPAHHEDQPDHNKPSESTLSKILSGSTLKKVVACVLLITIIVPFFDPIVYSDPPRYPDLLVASLQNLLYLTIQSRLAGAPLLDVEAWTDHSLRMYSRSENPLVYFYSPFNELPQFGEMVDFSSNYYESFAVCSKEISVQVIMRSYPTLTLRQSNDRTLVVIASLVSANKADAYFSLGRITYVGLVIFLVLHFFAKDTNTMIVKPIEDMMQRVREVARNPVAIEDKPLNSNHLQTTLVQNTLIKISNLLSVVFGVAGAEIIGHSILHQGQLNLAAPGKKRCAIYGLCRIRNFAEITEVLQEDTLILVNLLANIVHSSCYRYGGNASRNTGDTLLMVWSLPEEMYEIASDGSLLWTDSDYVQTQCDFAVFSFVKALVKTHKEPKVLRYRKDQRLLQKFGSNYEVGLQFALHIGWAIQGTLGSQQKVDVSFLGPHIDQLKLLISAAALYQAPIVLSQAFSSNCSHNLTSNFCRRIDRVQFAETGVLTDLFTVDVDMNGVTPPSDKSKKYPQGMPQQCDIDLKRELNLSYLHDDADLYNALDFVNDKKQLRQALLNNSHIGDFRACYEMGLDYYLGGDWQRALSFFNRALRLRVDDGPTRQMVRLLEGKSSPARGFARCTMIA